MVTFPFLDQAHGARIRVVLFGTYPSTEQWRSGLSCLVLALGAVLVLRRKFWAPPTLMCVGTASLLSSFVLLSGGPLLIPVGSRDWGGLPLTLLILVYTLTVG